MLRNERDEAEGSFQQALAIAQARGERSLELRAATSLARLLATEKRHDEAEQILGGIYGWFTEGSDTADLRAARSLHRAVSGCVLKFTERLVPVVAEATRVILPLTTLPVWPIVLPDTAPPAPCPGCLQGSPWGHQGGVLAALQA